MGVLPYIIICLFEYCASRNLFLNPFSKREVHIAWPKAYPMGVDGRARITATWNISWTSVVNTTMHNNRCMHSCEATRGTTL